MSSATQLPQLPEVERMSSLVIRIIAGNPSKFTLQGQIPPGVLFADADPSKARTPTSWVAAVLVSCSILARVNYLGLAAFLRFSHQNLLRYLMLSSHIGILTTLAAWQTFFPFAPRYKSISVIRQAGKTRFMTAKSLRQKGLHCEHSIVPVTLQTIWLLCWKRRTQCSQATMS